MNRKIYIPMMYNNISDDNIEQYIDYCKQAKATNVFISFDRDFFFNHDRTKEIERTKQKVKRFKDNGFVVGIWITAFGYGNPMSKKQNEIGKSYVKIKSALGNVGFDAFCPTSEEFMKDYLAMVGDAVKIGADMLMLDDDFCLSVRPGIGCFCDNHLKMMNDELGTDFDISQIREHIFKGGKNIYRDAYIKIMKNTMSDTCRKIREFADKINPDMKIGICAGYTSWDIEGADTIELSKILAGKNKPFFRFTGAPYWCAKDVSRFSEQRLSSIIECARYQKKWAENFDGDYFTEADSYPRPRNHVPASLIECFDLATYASDNSDTLKYVFDYFSNPSYEKGYIKNFLKYEEKYKFIEKHFLNKKCFGVYIPNEQRKFANMDISEFNEKEIMYSFFSTEAAMLSGLGIPTMYDENNMHEAIFGENARYVNKLSKKVLIDIKAAEILSANGIDVGIISKEKAQIPCTETECRNNINLYKIKGKYYNCKFNDNAEIVSEFKDVDGNIFPACVKYNNGVSEFLILCFDAESENESSSVFRSYIRQNQLINFFEDMPYISFEPDIYQIAKKNDDEMVILLENLSLDTAFDFEIILDRDYSSLEIVGAKGQLNKNKIKIMSDFYPFSCILIRALK